MSPEQLLDKLSGVNVPDTQINQHVLNVEFRLIDRLCDNFNLGDSERRKILLGLYRFRKTLSYFCEQWIRDQASLSPEQQKEASVVFNQVYYNLNRDSRSCFTTSNFFGKIRFLLEACKKLDVPEAHRNKYLELVLHFPISPVKRINEMFTHELYPSNLPHVYMDMAAGMLRGEMVKKTEHIKMLRKFKTFQWERNKPFAHNTWFKSRLAGSVCTRK